MDLKLEDLKKSLGRMYSRIPPMVGRSRTELDRDPGAAGIPAGIWRFCPGPGPGRDFVFSRDFSRDFSKIKSVFERKFEPKFHEPVNIFRKVLLQQCSSVLLNS